MVLSGLRKIKKKNPKIESIYSNPPNLSGAIFIFGRIKSGKTATMMSFAQIYHDHPQRQYKIWDLWGGSRNEHLYWTLPSNKTKYWKRAKKLLNLNKEGPKQYKVNLLYPVTRKLPLDPKKNKHTLPNNPPYVKSKAFTIPLNDIETQDIELTIGTIPPNISAVWRNAKFQLGKKMTPAKVYDRLRSNHSNSSLYQGFIYPLIKQDHLLQSPNCDLNIDIEREMRDQETISVVCLDFVEPEFRLFIMGYFMRKITEALDKKRFKKQVVLMREASDFFRVTDQSSVPERTKIFKSKLSENIRMGRRGFHMCCDENTKVISNGKNIKIKDLPEKDFNVKSYNFKNKKIEDDIAKKTYMGERECYKIELEDGRSVVLTEDHKLFSDKNRAKMVKNFKEGDYILEW